jgi:hypothetical protein
MIEPHDGISNVWKSQAKRISSLGAIGRLANARLRAWEMLINQIGIVLWCRIAQSLVYNQCKKIAIHMNSFINLHKKTNRINLAAR